MARRSGVGAGIVQRRLQSHTHTHTHVHMVCGEVRTCASKSMRHNLKGARTARRAAYTLCKGWVEAP